MVLRCASFLELFISSITEIGWTFPAVRRELNSPSVVKPTYKKTALYLRKRKHVLCFFRVTETQVKVWENEKYCGDMSLRWYQHAYFLRNVS